MVHLQDQLVVHLDKLSSISAAVESCALHVLEKEICDLMPHFLAVKGLETVDSVSEGWELGDVFVKDNIDFCLGDSGHLVLNLVKFIFKFTSF